MVDSSSVPSREASITILDLQEVHCQRTLTAKGEKTVECVVQTTTGLSHSVTILPSIFLDGEQSKKLYVQLGESSGKLPKKGCYGDDVLVVRAAKTHIMGVETAKVFFQEIVFHPAMVSPLLLLLDSWPVFINHSLIQSWVPPGKTVFIVNIPAGGTSLCQPLDLNYNMQFKSVVRRVHDFVLNHALQYKISMRDNILKLCSQIFWSFGAPRFTDFRRYGFFKGGFLDAHPGPFETPPEFMFGPSSDDFCSCSNVGFARCPHCSVAYCFQCFFVNLHRCC